MANIAFSTDQEWHALRAKHVGASETAALHGMSPFITRWQLYMQKTGKLPRVEENASMSQGRHFEPAIAAYAQEKYDISLRKVRRYMTADDCDGMGASVDYEEYGGGSLIPTEIKFSLWGDGWDWAGDELTQIPDAYMLQVQHQLGCCNAPHAQIIAFTGGDLRRMVVPRSDGLVGAIKLAVSEFWSDVAAGKEPPVDFLADADAVQTLLHMSPLRKVEMNGRASDFFKEYIEASAAAKEADDRATSAKTALQTLLLEQCRGVVADDAKIIASCGKFKMTVSRVDENPGKPITAEMIGQVIGARKGYSRVTISQTKEK